ncbi:hypothetical protein [Pelosinus sp. IPA-1]|uniref:rolling circle replication-associated protein n=1 Tax=Pelosinus sp. IPA-1 TaxID=3029569 RepID=UPI0024362AB6|nr:hypothetical protein [Pelosinus sp. IPA-1]GMB01051.1 hypothetical protein PIPA1_38500 [Pelosinus sp. IPA-1]
MGYWEKEVRAGNTIEKTKYKSGRKNLKIEIGPKVNETSDKQKRQNDKNAENKCRWDINANFKAGDWWICLRYPPKTKPSKEKVKADIDKFFRETRKVYRKAGKELKYIMSVGFGERGAVHFHLIMNYIEGKKIAAVWYKIAGTEETPYPRIEFTPMDSRQNHGNLASYIIKNTLESFYDEKRRIYAKRYCKSSNLKKPKIKVRKVSAKNWRKPKAPKGYYIDKQYSYEGYSDDGYQYQHYVLVKIHTAEDED